MAKGDWKFNPMTGTMEPVNPLTHGLEQQNAQDEVEVRKGGATVPVIKSGKSMIGGVPARKPNVSMNEHVVSFKEKSDLSVIQITDYDTNRIMGYISGYGLDIKFNMEELSSMDRVEQFLEGLKKAFRSVLLNQALGK